MKKNLLLICISFCSLGSSQINSGLKAFYPFSGNPNDHSGSNHNAQIIGNLNLTDDRFGTADSAYQFPGSSTDYMKVNYADDFDIAPSESFSVSLWYKGGSVSPGDFELLFGKENNLLTYKPYDYFAALYDGNRVVGGGMGYEVLWSPVGPPQPDPDWHHVVLIYDNKNWYLYQDNVLTKTSTNTPLSQSAEGLLIGKKFQGAIDDVRFYNRKLTAAEIDDLYSLTDLAVSNQAEDRTINVFPNPTKGTVNVSANANVILQLVIYDMTGKQILSNPNFKKEMRIDLSKFPNGIYTLKTVTKNAIKTQLIIKKD